MATGISPHMVTAKSTAASAARLPRKPQPVAELRDGDAGHDQRAADQHAARHLLAQHQRARRDADGRHEIEEGAGRRGRQARRAIVPGDHGESR